MSRLILNQGAAPSTPASGKNAVYADTARRVSAVDDRGNVHVLSPVYKRNLARNSGFWFARRQAPGTATTYSNTTGRALSADGWGITNENASATYQRIDARSTTEVGLRSPYYGNFIKITTLGKLHVCQVLEGADIDCLRGRPVRVQANLKQIVATSPVVRLGLYQLAAAGTVDAVPATFISAHGANGVDPTLGTNLARIVPKAGRTPMGGTVSGNALSCTLQSTWTRFGAVFDVPSDCKNLIVAIWSNAQLTATHGFAIAEVMLTDGEEEQEWTPESMQTELDRVGRYYAKTFPVDTAPAQNAGVTTGCLRSVLGKAGATALAAQFQFRYPVALRAAATTLTTYNPAAANAQVRQIGGTAADLTATATANSTDSSVDVTATGVAAGTVGDQAGVHLTADAEL